MSLRPDDRYGRGRSASTSGRDRERSRSNVRAPEAPAPPSATRHSSYGYPSGSSPMPGSFDTEAVTPSYEVRAPPGAAAKRNSYAPTSSSAGYAPATRTAEPYSNGNGYPPIGGYGTRTPPEGADRPRPTSGFFAPPPPSAPPARKDHADDDLAYGADQYRSRPTEGLSRQSSSASHRYTPNGNGDSRYAPTQQQNPYGLPPAGTLPTGLPQAGMPPSQAYPPRPEDRFSQAQRDPPRGGGRSRSDSSSPGSDRYREVKPSRPVAQDPYRETQPSRPAAHDEYREVKPSRPMAHDDYREVKPSRISAQDDYREVKPSRPTPQDHYRDVQPSRPAVQDQYREVQPPRGARGYSQSAYDQGAQVMEMTPGHNNLDRTNSVSRSNRLSVGPEAQPPRSSGLTPGMSRLAVGGAAALGAAGLGAHAMGGGLPPPSPMLEAYRGTYQSISPMPLALRPDDDLDLEDLEPLDAVHSRDSAPRYNDRLALEAREREAQSRGGGSVVSSTYSSASKKRVKLYNAEDDAKAIASALNHHKPDTSVICDVLPSLSHDQIMELRKEYKKQVKVQGKGVNMSKHVKTKITGNFGKAVYITSLGRYESEGYWANFWYQSHGSRRELLIESLMGRTNAEIRMIKDEFKDKRYSDSLSRCMERELKMDKFRTAILMVLEERRQEEQDVYGPEIVHRDVDMLNRSMRAEKGGETAMLEIIVLRSDAHLREVLKLYERMTGENFARAALRKSGNLVGEVIAHILNGVINKPARDALLLQHAIKDIAQHNKDDELRYELLISRLVRMHWDKLHLARVKKEYYDKYRVTLENALQDATKGDFREFMRELCEVK